MPTALQIGAGKIGRGFLGRILRDGGYDILFVDTDPSLIERLNARGSYPLRLVTETTSQTHTIDGFRAVHTSAPAVLRTFAEADLVCTAVGVANLPSVAVQIAQGVEARAKAGGGPLDILLCENQWHAAALLRELIVPHLAPQFCAYFDARIGLVETVIGLMVPVPTEAMRAEDPLLLVTEPFDELPVAVEMLRGAVPPITGLIRAENIEAYEARKLYLHNMSHAALAYLGYQRGYEYIWQCVADEDIADVCRDAMTQTAAAITIRYGLSERVLTDHSEGLLRRFANKSLGDTVARVAADPLRKLRPTDRLVGAANLCRATGVDAAAYGRIIGAAVCYDHPTDGAALELQNRRRAHGDVSVLQTLCGIVPDSDLSASVQHALKQLEPREEQRLCL